MVGASCFALFSSSHSLPHSPSHSLDQLIALMDRMVADERLVLDGAVYRKR